jgi:flagellar hook-associated protein 3 FlgL
MIYNFLSSLNKSQERMNNLQEQMSDGKYVHRPSDDPIRAFRSLRFNVNLTTNEQYTQNAKDAEQWMNSTDTAMSSLSEIMISAKELAIQSVSANTSDAQKSLASKLDGLINQAITIANGQLGDRYIFAGQQDKSPNPPFQLTTIDVAGVPTEFVVYSGDLSKISMPIQAGPPDPRKDSVNLTGEEAFGPITVLQDGVTGVSYSTAGIFTDLLRIKEDLATGTPNMTFMSTTAIANIDKGHDRMLLAHTQLGARMSSYEMAQNMMLRDNTTIMENASANDDIDIAKATIDFKNNENIYNTALAVGARIMPPSLADFLK